MNPDRLLADMTALNKRMQAQLDRIKRHNLSISQDYVSWSPNTNTSTRSSTSTLPTGPNPTPASSAPSTRRNSIDVKAINHTPYPSRQLDEFIARSTHLAIETKRLRFDLEQKQRDRVTMCNAPPEIAQIYRGRLQRVSPYDHVLTNARNAFEVARRESKVCDEMFRLSGFREDGGDDGGEGGDGRKAARGSGSGHSDGGRWSKVMRTG